MLAGCSGRASFWSSSKPHYSKRVVEYGQPVPKGGGRYKVGLPYTIKGKTYTPKEVSHYDQVGIASWYGKDFHGRRTANSEVYDMEALTAAHTTLPLPSYVRVTNLSNGRSLVLRVNDRGPYAHNRVIDLSWAAASLLQIERAGTGRVRVQYLKPAPLNG
ncbi:MAG: septal ring lytic transglycosylase RlpA family protein, partial [Candidatus Thiodiazotropha sp.]